MIRSLKAVEKTFKTQMERLQTDYIDYYLMHMFTDLEEWKKLQNTGIEKWISDAKAAGRFEFARNIGMRKEPAFASRCVGCRACEKHCPQAIEISRVIREADRALRPLPYKLGISIAREII